MAQPIRISILANESDALRGMKRTGQAADGIRSKLAGVGTAIAGLGIGALAGAGAFLIPAVKGASDLNETASKIGVLFGGAAKDIEAFAATADRKMGQSKQTVLDGAATFAIYGKAANLSGGELTKFSTGMVQLASDVGSFSNADPAQVISDFGSAMRGEFDPIEKYGVLLNESVVKQRALKLGIITTTTQALTPQQRVLAVQAELMAQTSAAQGDFARTSGGLANQQRILRSQFENFRTTIGTALLPVVTQFVTMLNTKLMPTLNDLWAKHGPQITAALSDMSAWLGTIVGKLAQVDWAAAFERGKNAVKELGPAVKQLREDSPSLMDTLQVGGVIVGFLADHADELAKALPYLVAALVAVKVAQVGANVAATLSPVLTVAQVIASRSLAKANQELAASIVAQTAASRAATGATAAGTVATAAGTAAENTGIIARARGVASMVAYRAAAIATSVATKAWAAAQWLINFAMTANPLGLIVLAIAAVIAIIVLIATKTTWFQTAWKAAMAGMTAAINWIKDAAGVVWNWIKEHWPLLLAIITGPIGIVVGLVIRHWDQIKGATTAAFNAVKNAIGAAWDWIKGLFQRGVDNVKAVFSGILRLADWAFQLRDRIVNALLSLPGRLLGLGRDVMRGLANGIQEGLAWVRDKVKGLGNLIPGWLKSVLGIASPSKVMAGLGANIVDGLTRGIESQAGALQRTVTGLGNQITTGLSADPTVTITAAAAGNIQLDAVAGPGGAGAVAGGNVYQINVTVEAGGDPAETGRRIIKAVDAYERRYGRRRLVPA